MAYKSVCPDCNATGQSDKVWRGYLVTGTCVACLGQGYRELMSNEKPGTAKVNACLERKK